MLSNLIIIDFGRLNLYIETKFNKSHFNSHFHYIEVKFKVKYNSILKVSIIQFTTTNRKKGYFFKGSKLKILERIKKICVNFTIFKQKTVKTRCAKTGLIDMLPIFQYRMTWQPINRSRTLFCSCCGEAGRDSQQPVRKILKVWKVMLLKANLIFLAKIVQKTIKIIFSTCMP